MDQKTLFPTENKTKNQAPVLRTQQVTPVPISSQLDKQIEEWKQEKQQQKENIAYMKIEYIAEAHLDETLEGFSIETALERNFKPECDSFGGMWGGNGFLATPEKTNELLINIQCFKEKLLRKPYSKLHTGSSSFTYWLRDIPAGNIKIFYTEKVKEIIQCLTGENIDTLVAELDNMPENPATEADYEKAAHYDTLEKNIEEWGETMDKMKETLAGHFSISYGYGPQVKRIESRLDETMTDWNVFEKEYSTLKQKYDDATKERERMLNEMRNT